MTLYLTRRILYSLVVTFGVLVFVFFMVQMVGDPVKLMLPSDVPESTYLEMRESLGFNDPLPERFVREVGGWIQGDFGDSLWQRVPALGLALDRVPSYPVPYPCDDGHRGSDRAVPWDVLRDQTRIPSSTASSPGSRSRGSRWPISGSA